MFSSIGFWLLTTIAGIGIQPCNSSKVGLFFHMFNIDYFEVLPAKCLDSSGSITNK